MSHVYVTQYDQEFQDKTIILFILTDKTKKREKISRIYKTKTIITEILYYLALVQPYDRGAGLLPRSYNVVISHRNSLVAAYIHTHALLLHITERERQKDVGGAWRRRRALSHIPRLLCARARKYCVTGQRGPVIRACIFSLSPSLTIVSRESECNGSRNNDSRAVRRSYRRYLEFHLSRLHEVLYTRVRAYIRIGWRRIMHAGMPRGEIVVVSRH